METLDQPTASSDPSRIQLEALSQTIQDLSSAAPYGEPHRRASLSVQLIRLESDVQRLRIRSAAGEFHSEEIGELRNCRERLAQLERRWRPD
ncbi:MAG: hypothetical protein ACI9C1_001980 [Candidatus Aldehydirespiratoraceae bacterium]|jgi:hypothetical protein